MSLAISMYVIHLLPISVLYFILLRKYTLQMLIFIVYNIQVMQQSEVFSFDKKRNNFSRRFGDALVSIDEGCFQAVNANL